MTRTKTRALANWPNNAVSVLDYGAVGDGVTDDTAAIQSAIDTGRKVLVPVGQYRITSTLVAVNATNIYGEGIDSEIINDVNDVTALELQGPYSSVKDLTIQHYAVSEWGIRVNGAHHTMIDNVTVSGNGVAFGGIYLGAPGESGAYLSTVNFCNVREFTSTCVRVESTGTLITIQDCHIGSKVDGCHGVFIYSDGVHVINGQIGANNVGGDHIRIENSTGGDVTGPSIEGCTFEHVNSGEYGINITGAGGKLVNTTIRDIKWSAAQPGTLVRFHKSKGGRLVNPKITNATDGGILCAFTDNSQDDIITVDTIAATVPLTVNPSANKPVKIVTSVISSGQLSSITTYGNLVTKTAGILDFSKAYNVVHNGTAWNSAHLAVTNDSVTVLSPPANQGFISIVNVEGKSVQHLGTAGYDISTPELFKGYGGDRFNCYTTNFTTVPTGTTGANNATTLYVTAGNLYLEARNGSTIYQIIFS